MAEYAPFRRLREGDRVAVIAPASAPPADRLKRGLAIMRSWGLRPVVLPSARLRPGDGPPQPDTDHLRAADLTAAWSDPSTCAIWCARGGYGTQRVLDLLPTGLFSGGRSTLTIGFSDITALLHRAASLSGGQMVHGPVVVGLSELEPRSRDHLRHLLFDRSGQFELFANLRAWSDGRAEGHLLGGNIDVLATSVGTGDLPDSAGALVCLESNGQEPWVVDRAVTQLIRSGWLPSAAGIVVGALPLEDPAGEVEAALRDRLSGLGIPVWAGALFGHGPTNLAFPLGASAVVAGGRLRLV